MEAPRFMFIPVRLGHPLAAVPKAVLWRLLSGNNRQLGRCAGVFDDIPSAREAAKSLQQGLDACEQIIVRLAVPPRWAWSIMHGGSVAAVSGRSYESERAAVRGLDLFVTGAAVARVEAPEQSVMGVVPR